MPAQPQVLCVYAPPELWDAIASCMFDAGAQGVEERNDHLRLYVQTPLELQTFQSVLQEMSARITGHDVASVASPSPVSNSPISTRIFSIDADWDEHWQRALKPQAIADWVLRPTHATPAPPAEKTLWFKPQASFGFGEHPTTLMAAEQMRALVDKGWSVLDVGAGSGVLSMLAAKWGARVLAVDVDPTSVQATKTNLRLNHLESVVEVKEGSTEVTHDCYDLVVANLSAPTISALLPELKRVLTPNGQLLLTGILQEDAALITGQAKRAGLMVLRQCEREAWALLHCQCSDHGAKN